MSSLRSATRSAVLCAVWSVVAAAPVVVIPAGSSAQPDSSQMWQLKPLALVGTVVPSTGGTIREFHKAHVLDDGTLVFPARFGAGARDWALYWSREGRIGHYFVSGIEFDGPDGTRLVLEEQMVRFARIGGAFAFVNGVAGRNIYAVYGFSGAGNAVRLRGPGQEFAFRGEQYRVKSAFAGAPDDTELAFRFVLEGKRNIEVAARYDGDAMRPARWMRGDELPGMAGVRIAGFGSFGSDTIIDRFELDGAPYKVAVMRLTPASVERILAVGDRDPTDTTRSVQQIFGVTVGGFNTFVIAFSSWRRFAVSRTVYALYRRGTFSHVTDVENNIAGVPMEPVVGKFLWPDTLPFVLVRVDRREIGRQSDGGATYVTYRRTSEALLYGDSPIGRSLTMLRMGDTVAAGGNFKIARIEGPSPGLVLASAPNSYREWFLDARARTVRAQPIPTFPNTDRRRVTLSDVIAWRSPDEAVVQLRDGVYQMSRLPPGRGRGNP